DHRRLAARAGHRPPDLLGIGAPHTGGSFQHRNAAGDERVVTGIERAQLVRRLAHRGDAPQDILDHARESHAPPVLGRVDLLHAVALERLDLLRRDGAATADHHADVLAAAFAQHVHHVGEILVVAALVGAHGDRIRVLVDGGAHDVGDAAIVAEVHHLRAARLQQAPDHVDGGIVAVEQRGRGHEPQGCPGEGLLAAGRGRARLRDRAVKREAVIRAAAREFNRKGYHNTSLDDIAARLEVTKPTVYYYVTSKEQLLFQCFVAGVEQIRAAFRDVRHLEVPARERLNAVLRHYGEAVASE